MGNKHKDTRSLLTACLLQLDLRSGTTRLRLHRLLVEMALRSAAGPVRVADLPKMVDDLLDQEDVLTSQEVQMAVQSAILDGTVDPLDGTCTIRDQRRVYWDERELEHDRIREEFHEGVLDSIEVQIRGALDPRTGRTILAALDHVLQSAIYERSLHIATGLETIPEALANYNGVDVFSELESYLADTIPEERILKKHLVRKGIQRYIKKMPSAASEFLLWMHCNVLLHQLLNLDPRTQQLHRAWGRLRRFYLDTNVVVAYLFEDDEHHKAAVEVLDASANIGVQLLVAPVTIEELERKVKQAKRTYVTSRRSDLLTHVASECDDVIVRTYAKKKRRNPNLQWVAFIAQLEDLPEFLIDQPASMCLEEEGAGEELEPELLREIEKMIFFAKPDSPDRIIQHDAALCGLVYHLRGRYPADERGEKVWLLTTDGGLRQMDRTLAGHPAFDSPLCMLLDEWGSIAAPLQNALGFVFSDFIEYMVKSKLGVLAHPAYVDLDLWDLIIKAEIDVAALLDLSPEHACRVMTRLQKVRDSLSLLEMPPDEVEREDVESLGREIELQLEEFIEETDPLRQDLESLRGRLDIERQYVRRLESEALRKDEQMEELIGRIDSYEKMSIWERFKALFRRPRTSEHE